MTATDSAAAVRTTAAEVSFSILAFVTCSTTSCSRSWQPLIGGFTDRRPVPYATTAGMGSSLVGILLLAFSTSYPGLLAGAAFVGIGSAIFHPESSRVARMASGGRHGLAQSLFQVGGNSGTALGPLLAAFIVLPRGQTSIAWFAVAALLGMIIVGKSQSMG